MRPFSFQDARSAFAQSSSSGSLQWLAIGSAAWLWRRLKRRQGHAPLCRAELGAMEAPGMLVCGNAVDGSPLRLLGSQPTKLPTTPNGLPFKWAALVFFLERTHAPWNAFPQDAWKICSGE